MNDQLTILQDDATGLLKKLVSIPSFSKEEDGTADAIGAFLQEKGVKVNRHLNNIWAVNECFDASKPTILLNSHHDTVKPNPQYSKDPFSPVVENDKLYGLGSNDAEDAWYRSLLLFFIIIPLKILNIILYSLQPPRKRYLD